MNILDCILTVLIVVVLILAIRTTIRSHRQGNCCTGSCFNCYKDCNKELRR